MVAHGVLNANHRSCGAPLSTPHAYALLELLQAPEGLTTTELATRLSIDRTNVSRLMARMENAGEVLRRVDAEDGRSKPVILTARGRRVAEAVDASSAQHFAELGESLHLPVTTVIKSVRALEAAMARQGVEVKAEEP